MLEFGNQQFPPKKDCARIERYARYKKLFRGKHDNALQYVGSVFKDTRKTRKVWIVANYPGLITRACADLLFGEPPTFLIGGGTPAQQRALDDLVKGTALPTRLFQSQIYASSRGDTVLRVRDNGQRIMIEEVPPQQYFVELDPDNCQTVLSQAIAWVRSDKILRIEHHLPGWIIQQAFRMNGPHSVGEQLSLDQVYGPGVLQEIQATGINEPLLFHVPNMAETEEFFGISDYDDLEPHFEAINNRLSKIDSYLDKHSAPRLIGMPGMAGPDGDMDLEKDYFEPEKAEDASNLPRLLTWDGSMRAALDELEVLVENVFRFSEMAPAVFGLDKAGSIESGRAMRMRFVRTQAKINRKRMLYDPKVKDATRVAMELHRIRYGGPSLGDSRIDIGWKDGIPQDYTEAVETEAKRIDAGLTSAESAIQRIDQTTPELAREELGRIAAENASGATPEKGQEVAERDRQQQSGSDSGNAAPSA